jgi:hypothetical protein
MIRGYKELQRLGDLLDAELNGRHYDNDELSRLANNISQMYPSISGTLARMVQRQIDGTRSR